MTTPDEKAWRERMEVAANGYDMPFPDGDFDHLEEAFLAGTEAALKDPHPSVVALVEALKFYAHPDHYEERETLTGVRQPGVLTEAGRKAREALAAWEKRGEK